MCCLRQFLYPSEEDSYKLVRFLVERLAESSGSGSRAGLKGVDDIRKVKKDSSKSNPVSHNSGDGSLDFSYDKLGPKWDEFALKGEEPELLNIDGEDASVRCDANLTLQRLDEMSIDNASSRPGDTHSSKVYVHLI